MEQNEFVFEDEEKKEQHEPQSALVHSFKWYIVESQNRARNFSSIELEDGSYLINVGLLEFNFARPTPSRP